MKKRKAFTLIEVLVVLIIVAMLIWILFDIYITISRITFRVELQKYVNEELLFVTDTLQNLSNRNEIDYNEYSSATNRLFDHNWLTNVLYLSWEDWKIQVYASGCNTEWYCWLYMKKNNLSEFRLAQGEQKVLFKDTKFKIIPFEKLNYAWGTSACEELKNAYICRNNQWFWFMTQIYSQNYDKDRWTHNVYLNVQQFFNN